MKILNFGRKREPQSSIFTKTPECVILSPNARDIPEFDWKEENSPW